MCPIDRSGIQDQRLTLPLFFALMRVTATDHVVVAAQRHPVDVAKHPLIAHDLWRGGECRGRDTGSDAADGEPSGERPREGGWQILFHGWPHHFARRAIKGTAKCEGGASIS